MRHCSPECQEMCSKYGVAPLTWEHSASAAEREVKALHKRIEVLEERLRECSSLLEDYVLAEYPADLRDQYPDIYGRRFKRDIQPVMTARAALDKDMDDE